MVSVAYLGISNSNKSGSCSSFWGESFFEPLIYGFLKGDGMLFFVSSFNRLTVAAVRPIKLILDFGKNSNRSSRTEVFCKKGVLRNFTKFTGKHLCPSLLFNKVAGLGPATLLKRKLWHRRFPVNFVKFLRTCFLWNTSGGCFWQYAIHHAE